MKKFLLITGVTSLVAWIGCYYYLQYKTLSEYVVEVAGIKLLSLSLNNTTINLKLKIISHSKIEGTISDVDMDLYVNDEFVANAYQKEAMVIPQMGYNIVNINLQIENKALLKNVFEIGKGATGNQVAITVKGTTKIKSGFLGFAVPVHETYNTTLGELLKGI